MHNLPVRCRGCNNATLDYIVQTGSFRLGQWRFSNQVCRALMKSYFYN
jgi:hypothetical protein